MSAEHGERLTERLRLVPISRESTEDLVLAHADADVAKLVSVVADESRDRDVGERDRDRLATYGFHKWLAYDRVSGEVVGRGGVAPVPVDDDWGQIRQFLPSEPWVGHPHRATADVPVHGWWVEIGRALRRPFWGGGLASPPKSGGPRLRAPGPQDASRASHARHGTTTDRVQ